MVGDTFYVNVILYSLIKDLVHSYSYNKFVILMKTWHSSFIGKLSYICVITLDSVACSEHTHGNIRLHNREAIAQSHSYSRYI